MKLTFSILSLTATLMTSAQAAIMFDFGPTLATLTNLTNSPGHASGAIASSLTSWNLVGTADPGSLVFADGTTATGVSLNLGSASNVAFAGLTSLGLATQPSSSSALGNATNSGVYAGNSVGKDAIFTTNGTNFTATGFQIGGLAAGTYDVYLTMRNTNEFNGYSQKGWVGESEASGDFDFSSYGNATVVYANNSSAVTFWTENLNYVKLSVTLGTGDFLNLAVTDGTGAGTRGFLNSAQIVEIPETATWVFLAGGLPLLTILRRRTTRA